MGYDVIFYVVGKTISFSGTIERKREREKHRFSFVTVYHALLPEIENLHTDRFKSGCGTLSLPLSNFCTHIHIFFFIQLTIKTLSQ
jgi:hypothetical protein